MYHKAILLCEEAIRFYRDNAYWWQILGEYHANAKELDKAKRAINMALALNPYSNAIKLGLAYIYIKNEEFDNAIAICNKVLEIIPKHFFGRLYMGYAFYGKEDFEKAMEFIKKALEVNPNSDTAKYYLARIYFNQKKFNDALSLTKSRLNPYSRDFFDLVVEVMDEALKTHKICSNCCILSEKRNNFCTSCGSRFEEEA
ncbi:MAG: tetratricopeptide repeat protein [Promethearchaeota archaeon]